MKRASGFFYVLKSQIIFPHVIIKDVELKTSNTGYEKVSILRITEKLLIPLYAILMLLTNNVKVQHQLSKSSKIHHSVCQKVLVHQACKTGVQALALKYVRRWSIYTFCAESCVSPSHVSCLPQGEYQAWNGPETALTRVVLKNLKSTLKSLSIMFLVFKRVCLVIDVRGRIGFSVPLERAVIY